jgi:hypothetical protein
MFYSRLNIPPADCRVTSREAVEYTLTDRNVYKLHLRVVSQYAPPPCHSRNNIQQ